MRRLGSRTKGTIEKKGSGVFSTTPTCFHLPIVLGKIVQWPSAEEAKEFLAQKGALASWFEAVIIGNGSDLEEEQDDEGHGFVLL